MKKFFRFFAVSLLTVFAFLFVAAPSADAQKRSGLNKEDSNRYDVEYLKSVSSGVDQVRVWTYTRDKKASEMYSKRNAVHAVIFRGYVGEGVNKPALSRDPLAETNYSDFFNRFFAPSGDFAKYAVSAQDREIRKVGRDWKIGETVTVNTGALRKYLESNGVIKGLSYGF